MKIVKRFRKSLHQPVMSKKWVRDSHKSWVFLIKKLQMWRVQLKVKMFLMTQTIRHLMKGIRVKLTARMKIRGEIVWQWINLFTPKLIFINKINKFIIQNRALFKFKANSNLSNEKFNLLAKKVNHNPSKISTNIMRQRAILNLMNTQKKDLFLKLEIVSQQVL